MSLRSRAWIPFGVTTSWYRLRGFLKRDADRARSSGEERERAGNAWISGGEHGRGALLVTTLWLGCREERQPTLRSAPEDRQRVVGAMSRKSKDQLIIVISQRHVRLEIVAE